MMLRFAVLSCYILSIQLLLSGGALGSMETEVAHTNDPVLQQKRRLEFLAMIRRPTSSKISNNNYDATELANLPTHQHRALQAQFENVCNGSGVPDASGNVTALLAPDYQPTCTCTESNNLDSLQFDASTVTDPSQFAPILNELISNLFINIDWECTNTLATCFPSGDCALLDADYLLDFQGVQADFTLEELLALAQDGGSGVQVTQFLMGDQTTMLCSEYTTGQTGVACLQEITTVEQIQSTGDRPCALSYNNVNCGSCTITAAACVVSECSIHGIASVNTCTNTGVDTIFQVLPYYTGASSPTALIVGGSGPVPVSAPVLPPVVALTPVSAPVPVPVSAPVPVLEPVVTSTPVIGALTAAPTPSVVVETSAPTNSLSPVAGAATTVPVPAPVPISLFPVPTPQPVPVPVLLSVSAPPTPQPISVPLPLPLPVPFPVPAQVPVLLPAPIPTPTVGVNDVCPSSKGKGGKGSASTNISSSSKGVKNSKSSKKCKKLKKKKKSSSSSKTKIKKSKSTSAKVGSSRRRHLRV